MASYTLTAPEGIPYVVVEYVFDAPLDKVWKAMTDPELIPKWWGPAKYTTKVVKHEAKTGGQWEFHQSDAGSTHRFRGVYHEVADNERLIGTFEYLEMPEPGHVLLEKATFEEKDGKTLVHIIDTYVSQEDRDGMVAMGMESGLAEGVERLGALVEG